MSRCPRSDVSRWLAPRSEDERIAPSASGLDERINVKTEKKFWTSAALVPCISMWVALSGCGSSAEARK